MQRLLVWFAAWAGAFGVGWWVSCAPGEDDPIPTDVSDVRRDADVVDSEGTTDVSDAARCDANSQCDDHIDCTDDFCAAGGTCGHTAVHTRCPDRQRCNLLTGCSEVECTETAHCDDGLWCTGDETCISEHCFPGTVRTCDDGDTCTEDSCDDVNDRCVRTPLEIEGCERDAPVEEATPDPFDPLEDYAGTFYLFPVQSQSCGMATYSIETLGFSASGGTLTVTGPPCSMTQAPVPTGADFNVVCNQSGCGMYRLTGHFDNADNFSGHWTATFGGASCSFCGTQDLDVVGVRM